MPLLPGKKNVGRNIHELMQPSAHAPHGRPRKQAIAIALSELRREHRGPGPHTKALHDRRHRGRV